MDNKITGNIYKTFSNINEQIINNLNNTIKYHISRNLSNEIDEVLVGKYKSNNQVKTRDFTPEILVNNGVKDLPMLMTAKHIKSTILTEEEAKNNNMYEKNVNYHGLGKKTLINVINSLDNPIEIYKTSQNEFLIITEILDKQCNNIVVPIRINGKGTYNDVYIEENQIKSAYGRRNLTKYIQNNNFEKIYTKKGTTLNEGVQYSNISNSSAKNISQSKEKVKVPT